MTRFVILIVGLGMGIVTAAIPCAAQSVRPVGKNIESLLQQILANQNRMQDEIDTLKRRLEEKDRQIAELQSLVERQKSLISEQVQAVAGRTASATGAVDLYSARIQYDSARTLQHEVFFNIRKGEQRPWFEKAIQEFRKVVNLYPSAPEADDAQIRIARTYHRYLDQVEEAKVEYRFLLQRYPESEFAEEAREALERLQSQ